MPLLRCDRQRGLNAVFAKNPTGLSRLWRRAVRLFFHARSTFSSRHRKPQNLHPSTRLLSKHHVLQTVRCLYGCHHGGYFPCLYYLYLPRFFQTWYFHCIYVLIVIYLTFLSFNTNISSTESNHSKALYF